MSQYLYPTPEQKMYFTQQNMNKENIEDKGRRILEIFPTCLQEKHGQGGAGTKGYIITRLK